MKRFLFGLPSVLLWASLGMEPVLADEPPGGSGESQKAAATADGNSAADDSADDLAAEVEPGHSMHGEVFNEGPRQAAYLMDGMGTIDFEVSSSDPQTRKFFRQGVAQLHGFWYYEAERSFRQAVQTDPQCAMCYWGMALANVNNRKRAAGFIAKAVELKDNASEREQLYIEAARRRFEEPADGKKKPSKKEIAENYTRDLEAIVLKFPDDIDARALLALQLWENSRNDLPIVSHVAISALLEDVFDKQPMHPAHHYRIHLWDNRDPSQALRSAALCGPSLPGIAHMWHMPGHTYSNLHRYHDAVWQQEASARVDHAYMIRDRIMPDQIHNFAHNNEWMIRNLLKIGRIEDAISLATNMIQLPRHPKYNTLKSGSAKYGRERLLQSLGTYRLWPELIAAVESKLIEASEDDPSQIEMARQLGIAHALLDHSAQTADILADLRSRQNKIADELKEISEAEADEKRVATRPDVGQPPAPASADRSVSSTSAASADRELCDDKPDAEKAADDKKAAANRQRRGRERNDRKKELEARKKQIAEALAAVEASQAAASEQWDRAVELFAQAGNWDNLLKAEWLARAQKTDAALELAEAEIKKNPGTVLPSAVATYVRWQARGAQDAQNAFEKLREECAAADLDTPLLARLEPLATELGYEAAWAKPLAPRSDTGPRPSLDSLGPFRYSPYAAPTWQGLTRENVPVESTKYAGKPTIVIFYLGFGCLHCMEQLQEFSPMAEQFRADGIELVAVSNETPESLAQGIENYTKSLDIPLLADPELQAFKAFRCYDDFEKQPLHGTFLIDGQGRVLWQDISFEPFQDPKFLKQEAKRLLSLPR